jgi:hypothetical protein
MISLLFSIVPLLQTDCEIMVVASGMFSGAVLECCSEPALPPSIVESADKTEINSEYQRGILDHTDSIGSLTPTSIFTSNQLSGPIPDSIGSFSSLTKPHLFGA